MIEVHGPGTPFTTLFDEQAENERALPAPFQQLYSPWPLPEPTNRPFMYINFVMSHDGRVSFNIPGHVSSVYVSRRDPPDRWLMGLLRARADAVLLGGDTIATAGKHVWTPAAVFPGDAEAFAALRRFEGRAVAPLLVVLTRSGKLPIHAPALSTPELPVLIVTSGDVSRRVRVDLGERPWIRYLEVSQPIDHRSMMRTLRNDFGIGSLLIEAGPRMYGALLREHLIDDEFVTISPIIVGNSPEQPRPGLVEEAAFDYRNPPRLHLLSVHRHGSYVYLHSRYER